MEYIVNRNIESLEEIINEVPQNFDTLICNNKGLRSLRGIDRLPQITRLHVDNNQITSLEYIVGSNVTTLYIDNNPCYSEFVELESSIKKVKERYSLLDVKDPGFE